MTDKRDEGPGRAGPPQGPPAKQKSKLDKLGDLADRVNASEKMLDGDISLDTAIHASKALGGLGQSSDRTLTYAATVAGRLKAAFQLLKDDFSLKTIDQVKTLFRGSSKTLDRIFDVVGKILKKIGAVLSGEWIWTAVETLHEREKNRYEASRAAAGEGAVPEKTRLLKILDRVDEYRKKEAKFKKIYEFLKKIWEWIKSLWERLQTRLQDAAANVTTAAGKTVVAVKSSAVAMTVAATMTAAGVAGVVYVVKKSLDESSRPAAREPAQVAQAPLSQAPLVDSGGLAAVPKQPEPAAGPSTQAQSASAVSASSTPGEGKSADGSGVILKEGEYSPEDLEKLGILVNEK